MEHRLCRHRVYAILKYDKMKSGWEQSGNQVSGLIVKYYIQTYVFLMCVCAKLLQSCLTP